MTAPIQTPARAIMRHVLFAAVSLLCCAAVCAATALHRCGLDALAEEAGPPSTAVVLELPRRGRSGVSLVTASGPQWAPIRIRYFTEDLRRSSSHCTQENETRPTFRGKTAVCQKEDILTDKKRAVIVNEILPRAVMLHAERLLVKPVTGRIIVPEYTQTPCSSFTVPISHRRWGVENADMVLYIAAAPILPDLFGWAQYCTSGEYGRPVVGVLNLNPREVVFTDQFVRVAAHEIAHTLGFTSRVFSKRRMVRKASGVRGKAEVTLLNSPKVLEKARAHYNCPTAPGMELEDEGHGGGRGSHWEMRNAKDELMTGVFGIGYYTALTMAAFEDMGFYRANWSMAETMNWGKNSGCRLLTEKCMTKGKTAYPDIFCSSRKFFYSCSFDRLGLGRCRINANQSLLLEHQYFKNPREGGVPYLWTDRCPVVNPFSNTKCANGEFIDQEGSRVGPRSRCLIGRDLYYNWGRVGGVCTEVECNKNRGTVRVRYLGDDRWHACPEGGYITPGGNFTKGEILCPKYSEVCFETGRDTSEVDLSPIVIGQQ